jgi:DNA-binding SARP family transcriptional activator
VHYAILGPLTIERGGAPVHLGAPKQRALLTHLLVHPGHTVPTDRLIEALWGDEPPGQARVTLRSYLSNLRRTIGDADGDVIVATGNGYALAIDPVAVDVTRFERLAAAGRASLAAGDPGTALEQLEQALGLWRGDALADATDDPALRGEAARLEELRRSTREDRHDCLLALGRPVDVIASAEAFLAEEPLRERARGQLMLALYREGRAADALASFQRLRQQLVDEHGLDPGPQLERLADRILRRADDLAGPGQDDTLPVPPPAVATAPRGAADHGPTGVVGREHERAELRATVGRLLAGEGSLLLLVGEPGIGKTTLLEALTETARAEGVPVLWGRCPETEGAPAFWPWVQVLRDLAAGASDDELARWCSGFAAPVCQLIPDVAERLGEAGGAAGVDADSRFALYDALATFVRRAAADSPLVVALDDLHWADTSSLQLLAFLAPQLSTSRVLVAASYRDVVADWAPELATTLAQLARTPALQQIGLSGLLPTEVARLAAGPAGHQLSEDEVRLFSERTGGNPFFVRQLARLLHETSSDPRGRDAIPTGIRHVIASRLSTLPAATRTLLEAAAIGGRTFALRPVARAAGMDLDDALTAIEAAVLHGLVEDVGRPLTAYRFVHALVRETIAEALTPARAARLHRDVGVALEDTRQPPVAELAEHFWQAAELVDDDRPVRYLLAAADDAREVFAHEQAEVYLRRAWELRLAADADAVAELEVLLRLLSLLVTARGWTAADVGDVSARARHLARTVGLGGNTRVSIWITGWAFHVNRSELHDAVSLADELLAGAGEADRAAIVGGHAMGAYAQLASGRDPALVLAELEDALTLATAPDPTDHIEAVLTVTAHLVAGLAHAYRGEREAALRAADRAVRLAADIEVLSVGRGDRFARAWAAMMAGWVGILAEDPDYVARVSAPGLELCDRYGFTLVRRMLSVSNRWAQARLGGDAARLADEMRDGVGEIRRLGAEHGQAQFLLFAAETYLLAGERVRARETLDEAVELSQRTGDLLPVRRLAALESALSGGASV